MIRGSEASNTNMAFDHIHPPCQGYCDVFQKCRAVDAEGPLARLKNLLFNQDTLNSVAEWITVSVAA